MILKIKKIKNEIKDVISVIFKKPKKFFFYPGQYLEITLPVKDRRGKNRDFTISSSPTEKFLMITTKKGVSPFKKYLHQLKVEDEIIASHPAGTFILDKSSPAVFFAGGVGITPFRSMIKYAVDSKLSTPITLIYFNSSDNFLFKKVLDGWKSNLPNLKVVYIQTPTRFARRAIYPLRFRQASQLPIYYLAGPPKMVDDFSKMLLELGVDETNIRYDRFDGY